MGLGELVFSLQKIECPEFYERALIFRDKLLDMIGDRKYCEYSIENQNCMIEQLLGENRHKLVLVSEFERCTINRGW